MPTSREEFSKSMDEVLIVFQNLQKKKMFHGYII
jgi:hypothetical protein